MRVGPGRGRGLEKGQGRGGPDQRGTSHGRGHVEGAGTRRGGARQKGRGREDRDGAGSLRGRGGARGGARQKGTGRVPGRTPLVAAARRAGLLAAEPGAAAGTQGPRAGSRASAGRHGGGAQAGGASSPGLAGDSGTGVLARERAGAGQFQRARPGGRRHARRGSARVRGAQGALWRPRSGAGASRLLRVTLVPLGPASSDPRGSRTAAGPYYRSHQTRLLRAPGGGYELFVPWPAQRRVEKSCPLELTHTEV